MGKIKMAPLVHEFQIMYQEHWPYVWGAARKGCVDCSGAYVYAYSLFKQYIYHGSNAIARRYVVKLLPVSQAKPGMAAFKARAPGHRYYGLPDKYKKGGGSYNGDLNDYYHIGLVDLDGKGVLNAQSEALGFGRSPVSKWLYVAELKAVEYPSGSAMTKEGAKNMKEMIVTCPQGETVNVRDKANGKRIDKLPAGTTVMAGDDVNGWREIVYQDRGGYMSSEFLKPAHAATMTDLPEGGDAQAEPPAAYVKTITTDDLNALCDAMDKMEGAVKTFRDIIGVG